MPACYRHPDRETAVSCSNCGNPICPDCMSPSPVGMRCPDCAGDRTKVIHARQLAEPRIFDVAPVTTVLIVLNVIAYLAELVTGSGASTISGSNSGSVLEHGVFYGPLVADGEWWRIVTSGFLHLGFIHVGMNMLLLFLLGRQLEPAIGSLRFIGIYMFSLVAGSLGSMLLEPTVSAAGASGAVFGLMSAAVIAQRSRGINPWESGIGGLIVLNLLLTFAVPGIAKGGHLGGLIGGLLISVVLIDLDETRRIFGNSKIPAVVIGVVATVALFALTVLVAQGKWPAIAAL